MKKIFLSAVILLSCVAFANAQMPEPGEVAKMQVAYFKEFIPNLTESQSTRLESVITESVKVVFAAFEKANGDFDGMQETMEKLEKEKQDALAKFLTEEQMEVYRKKQQELMERFRNG
jgi:flagellar motility protein MotE (MotC chaperone)